MADVKREVSVSVYADVKSAQQNLKSFAESAKASFEKVQNSSAGVSSSFNQAAATAKSLAKGIAIAGTALSVLGGLALREAAKFEDLEKRFKVLLGSTELAKERIKELNQFALVTPFQVDEVAKASAILQTFAGDALATGDGLRFVGDMAAFAQQPIDQVAIHAGRIVDALQSGRPFGESAQRLQELGLISGAARAQMEAFQGQTMSSAEAIDILKTSVTNVNGTMAEMNDTISGQLSNVEQQFREKLRGVGEIIAEVFDVKDNLRGFSEQLAGIDLEPFRKFAEGAKIVVDILREEISDFVDFVRTYVVPPVIKAWETIIKKLDGASGDFEKIWKDMKKTMSTVVIFLVNQVLPLLVKAIGAVIDTSSALRKIWDKNILGIKTTTEAVFGGIYDFVVDRMEGLGFLFGTISSLMAEDWAALWENVKGVVSSAVNGVTSTINILIQAINAIPGVSIPLIPRIDVSIFNAELERLGQKSVGIAGVWSDSFKQVGTATKEVETQVEQSSSSIVQEINKIGGGGGGGGGAKGAADDVEKAKEKMIKDLKTLDDKFEETAQNIGEKLKDLNKEIADVTKSFNQDRADARADIASDIVKSEERIGEIQKKIAEEQKRIDENKKKLIEEQTKLIEDQKKAEEKIKTLDDDKKIAEEKIKLLEDQKKAEERINSLKESGEEKTTNLDQLKADLEAEKQARIENKDFIASLEAEVVEAKRFNSLTSLEQSIEIFKKEQDEARIQFEEKIGLLREEVAEVEKQKSELIAIDKERNQIIMQLEKDATEEFKAEMNKRVEASRAAAAEIRKALISARGGLNTAQEMPGLEARAKGGNVNAGQPYLVGEKGAELFIPNQSGSIVPNNQLQQPSVTLNFGDVSIGNDMDAESFYQTLERRLVRTLQLQQLGSI